jgi:uncharacterized protein YbaR (Trm112 family)
MHILLTDILSCPRCGPQHGLILLADRLEERRVLDGWLGCANCRDHYPLVNGALDLRVDTEKRDEVPHVAPREDGAAWLAALMGLAGANGNVAIVGGGAELAPAVAALIPDIEVVAITDTLFVGPEAPQVSRMAVAGETLPFRGGVLRALALTGGSEVSMEDAVRVVAPGGRLVVDDVEEGAGAQLRALGAEVLLEQDRVLVARVPGIAGEPVPGAPPSPYEGPWGGLLGPR